jgi:hypothetical protein
MKTNLWRGLLLLLVAGAGVLLYQQRSVWVNIFRTSSTTDRDQTAILFETADQYIRQGRLDSASHYLDMVTHQRNESADGSWIADSARALRWQIKQIGLLDTGNLYIGILLNMPDQEYEDFLKGIYHKKYLGHPDLNRLFLKKLSSKNQAWEQNNGEVETALTDLKPANAARRKEFAEAIKNSFVNLGFDIEVDISGTDSTRLILYADEFNDEWFDKFESDSAMSDWHRMGFQQVEIRGNSGYLKVKTW